MHQSTIIVDPKSEIKGKQNFDTYIIQPTIVDRRESIRLKDVQLMIAWCAKSAFQGARKMVIIEELHKGSHAVPHTLLKLLEEPPVNTYICMTIDRAESILDTIRSRSAIIFAHNLNTTQLEQLSLQRVMPERTQNSLSWEAFITMPNAGRIEWLSRYIKSKQDPQLLLWGWQTEQAEALGGNYTHNRVVAIKQLALLEEVSAALRQNVLPRLALQYLHIKLDQL
jgi:hypothetical protein